MSVYHNLEQMKMLALVDALQFGDNVNVIISNPDPDGQFSWTCRSTYEKVADSYFNKPRTAVIVYKTDDEPNIELARALVKKDAEAYVYCVARVNYCVTLVAKGLTTEVLEAEAKRLGYVIEYNTKSFDHTCTLTFSTPEPIIIEPAPQFNDVYIAPTQKELSSKFYDRFYRKRF